MNWFRKLINNDTHILKLDVEITAMLSKIADLIELKNKRISNYEHYLHDREDALIARSKVIDALKKDLDERASVLTGLQANFEFEKESFLGKDGSDLKRKILLPIMQAKWDAEAKKLDAERSAILSSMPKINISLSGRKFELQARIEGIKKKPANSGNNILLVQCESALDELNGIINMIDKERNDNAATDSSNVHP